MIASRNYPFHIAILPVRDYSYIRKRDISSRTRVLSALRQIYPRDRFDLIGFNSLVCGKIKSTRIEFPTRTCNARSQVRVVLYRVRLLLSCNISDVRISNICERKLRRVAAERERERKRKRKRELVRSEEGPKVQSQHHRCNGWRFVRAAAAVVVVVVAAFCASSGVEREAREKEKRRGGVISDVAAFIPLAPVLASSPSLDLRPQPPFPCYLPLEPSHARPLR